MLRDKKAYACYDGIEKIRGQLLCQRTAIAVTDFGVGSSIIKTNKRVVADIAGSSLKPAKYARLLFRMVHHYQPQTILELGTSFGITTSYLAAGNAHAKVHTLEGDASIAALARKTFKELGLKNIELREGEFSTALSVLLKEFDTLGLAFIDGNHRKGPTLEYFRQLLEHVGPSTILIFDDIHWSPGMEAAWEEIREDPLVTLSIDLFFLGIVFFSPDFKIKQHHMIRF